MTENRTYNIGASEVAGLLKEYAGNLLASKIIDEETHDKLVSMPNYLDTAYSINKKLKFMAQQKKDYAKFAYSKFMKRGHDVEDVIKDIFLLKNANHQVVESQVRKTKQIEGCKFPLVAVIDYKLADGTILEVKSTDANEYNWSKINDVAFNYYIQAQCQLWLHDATKAIVFYGAVITNDDKHQIVDTKSFNIKIDREIINAVAQSIKWFCYQYDKGVLDSKDENLKTSKDFQVDEFLKKDAETIEIIADAELSSLISKVQELEAQVKEYDNLQKQLREIIKRKMEGNKRAVIKSNQFELQASYSKASFHDEESKQEAIKKAQEIEIGNVKSAPKLTIKLEGK
jgi:hypothetical protein